MLQYQQAGKSFQDGQQLFQGMLNLMDQGVQQFVSKGKVNFDSLLASFLSMVAQMELKAATSQIFNALGLGGGGGSGSGGGGILGGLLGLFGLGGNSNSGGFATVGSGAGVTDGVPNFTGMAGGGQPPLGQATLVGENGPELFVPNSAGQVVSNKDLSGGGDGVTIRQNLVFGSDVDRGWLENRLARHKQETVDAVLAAKRQGGRKMAAAFGGR
jgi:lambda family phage tail tape measure protein